MVTDENQTTAVQNTQVTDTNNSIFVTKNIVVIFRQSLFKCVVKCLTSLQKFSETLYYTTHTACML